MMETPEQPAIDFYRPKKYPEELFDGKYTLVQHRLEGGAVYRGEQRYLRIGPKASTVDEEIKTRAMKERGFPVPQIYEHGELNGDWYFVEEDLGEKHFGQIFAEETKQSGKISDKTYAAYLGLMSRYAEASFGSKNRSHRGESIRVISLYNETKNQYRINPDLLEEAITRAENKLESSENGLISADLGPFNTMPKGAIDFEFLHTGPIGYDVYTAPIIGFYFPEAAKSYRQKMYDFSDKQLSDYYHNMEIIAHKHQHGSLLRYWNEFILLKTIWAAAKPKDYRGEAFSDPEREYFWSVFRFNILQHVIDHYLKGGELLPQKFPEIGVSGKW